MLYSRAVHDEAGIPEWPADAISIAGRVWSKEKKRKSRLQASQFPDYWKALQKQPEKERDYFTLLLLTGCRKSELLGLTVDDVDLRAGTFTFTGTKNHEDHTLPMPDTIREILKRRVQEAKGSRLFVLDPRTTTNRIIKAVDIKITPHDCRRTFASIGIAEDKIAVLLNQVSGQTVTSDYIGERGMQQKQEDMQAVEARIMEYVG